jgi:hypothetical protein
MALRRKYRNFITAKNHGFLFSMAFLLGEQTETYIGVNYIVSFRYKYLIRLRDSSVMLVFGTGDKITRILQKGLVAYWRFLSTKPTDLCLLTSLLLACKAILIAELRLRTE